MASASRRRIIFPEAAVTMAERATSIRHNDPLEDSIDRGIRLEHRTGKWNPLFGKADARITSQIAVWAPGAHGLALVAAEATGPISVSIEVWLPPRGTVVAA
jgi:hypothetical protein